MRQTPTTPALVYNLRRALNILGLVSEETQDRHHDARHPAAAAATAGLTLAPRAILHAIEDITQSHACS